MKFFKKPVVAVICTVLIVLLSTSLSVKTKFEKKCLEVVDGFYDGELYTGETEVSIAKHLADICGYSLEIIEIAEAYDIDADDALYCVDDIQYGMTEWYDDVGYIHYCYEELIEEIEILNQQLYAEPLTAAEQQQLSALNWNISESTDAISESGYNESVRQFIRRNMQFPTDLLCDIAGVYPPEYFK